MPRHFDSPLPAPPLPHVMAAALQDLLELPDEEMPRLIGCAALDLRPTAPLPVLGRDWGRRLYRWWLLLPNTISSAEVHEIRAMLLSTQGVAADRWARLDAARHLLDVVVDELDGWQAVAP